MTTFHMSGVSSGQDTQSIIEAMVKARSYPLDTWAKEQVEIENDLTAWGDLNTLMTNLTESLDTLRSYETWNKMSATSLDDTVLTATAGSSAVEKTYSIVIDHLAQQHTVASSRAADLSTGATATTDLVAAGVLTAGDQFTIEGQTITVGSTESLSSLRTKINTAASSMSTANRVYASIMDNRLVIARVNSGSTEITMSDTTNTPLQDLGVLTSPGVYANELVVAQDAEFTVDGALVTRSTNTNLTDVIENLTLNLKGESLSAITLEVGRDRETPKNAILDFVEKYNAAATALDSYGQINVQGEDPKGATVDSDTTGELFNDSLLSEIKNNLRRYATEAKPLLSLYNGYKNSPSPSVQVVDPSYTYDSRSGTMDSLDDVGIWTTDRTNQLSLIDEDKLDYVLDNYFDQTEQLFRGVFTSANGYQDGIATDFYKYSDNVSTSLTGDIARRESTLKEKYTDLDTQMTDLQNELEEYTQDLWEIFTNMEDRVASLNDDLTALTSKLGS